MTTMRALSLREGAVSVREVPRPVPGHGQLLVRTLACAICASDHHYMDHPEVAEADRSRMRVHAPDQDVVMGHEYCAEVVEYGPGTQQQWPVGTRVTSPPALFVDGGLRIIGMAPDAPGGFGEYFLLSEGMARPLPDHLPVENLALIDALAVGWYYTRLGTAHSNTVPLVVGLGAIGLSVVLALKQRGVEVVVAADFDPARRELARTLGADVVVDPRQQPAYDAWRQAAWGAPQEVHDPLALGGRPTAVVYECTGAKGVLGALVDDAPASTRIMSAGGAAQDVIGSANANVKGVNIQFGGGPDVSDWYEMADLVVSGQIDPTPFVGETVDLDGLPDAFARARSSSAPVRIVFVNSARG